MNLLLFWKSLGPNVSRTVVSRVGTYTQVSVKGRTLPKTETSCGTVRTQLVVQLRFSLLPPIKTLKGVFRLELFTLLQCRVIDYLTDLTPMYIPVFTQV